MTPLLASLLLLTATPDAAGAAGAADRVETLTSAALMTAGDVDRGRRLYASAAMQCTRCHRNDDPELAPLVGDGVTPTDDGIGPNLTAIGNKFDRPHLIDSLLHPSREIGYGYRPQIIRLDDGRTLTGLVRSRTDTSLTLVDAAAQPVTVATDDIEAEKPSTQSLMPAGLIDPLTPDQFADLVAYLESRRPGSKGDWGSGTAGPIGIPDGWTLDIVATGLDGATQLETLPDGRVLVAEQTGRVRVIQDDTLLDEPLVLLDVDTLWERGVTGVTVDPGFPAEPWVYLTHVKRQPYPHTCISRFRIADHGRGNRVVPASGELLFEGDDQRRYAGPPHHAQVVAGHQGGGLHFGPDGCLYLGIGEHTAGQPAQSLDAFLGKIIRINRDGSIPADNPLLDRTEGRYGAIWATGCRNPFTFAIRDDGLMLINDVGGQFEEINVGRPGRNYGWPTVDHGPRPDGLAAADDQYQRPVHWYPQASISGGDFAPAGAGELAGKYVFADFVQGWIHAIDPSEIGPGPGADENLEATEVASGMRRPCDLRFAADGSLYVLLRNAWVIDGQFVSDTGSVVKLTPPQPATTADASESDASPFEVSTFEASPFEASVPVARQGVTLDQQARDAQHGFPVWRITTPAATYEFDPLGGGLSGLIDVDGHDWIGFRPKPGTKESGEYRGWPNAVYRPPAPGLFHPQNENTDTMQTELAGLSPDRVTISSRSDDGWAGEFVFTPTEATFRMTAVPDGGRYWVLYEGTPGGRLDKADTWSAAEHPRRATVSTVTDDGESRQPVRSYPVTRRHDADLPGVDGVERFRFTDSATGRAVELTSSIDDDQPDTYYAMGLVTGNDAMTVFGFGRTGIARNLTRPGEFTIRLVEPGRDKEPGRDGEPGRGKDRPQQADPQ